jgi:hypothetical protein
MLIYAYMYTRICVVYDKLTTSYTACTNIFNMLDNNRVIQTSIDMCGVICTNSRHLICGVYNLNENKKKQIVWESFVDSNTESLRQFSYPYQKVCIRKCRGSVEQDRHD